MESQPIKVPTGEICSYGCGKSALFVIGKTRRFCCSKTFHGCPAWVLRKEETLLEHYGVRHPAHSKKINEKREQTCLEKFGTKSPLGNAQVQAKRASTCLEKYGGTSPTSSLEVVAKTKRTNIERYGFEAPAQSLVVQKKMQATTMKRYGKRNFFQAKEFDSIRKQTNLAVYGTNHPMQSPIVKKRLETTNLERYGVPHPFQNPAVVEKYIKTRYAKDAFTLPSGKIVYLQGYEKRVLEEFLRNGMSETDFELDRKKQPIFWYSDPITGKRRRYFPDFYLPRLRWVVEVKSTWTLFGRDWWAENKAKRKACISAGYKFNFIIR